MPLPDKTPCGLSLKAIFGAPFSTKNLPGAAPPSAKAVTDLVAPLSDADLWRVAQFVAGEIRRRDKDFGPPIMVRRP